MSAPLATSAFVHFMAIQAVLGERGRAFRPAAFTPREWSRLIAHCAARSIPDVVDDVLADRFSF